MAKKFIRSKDIIFLEDQMVNDEQKSNKSQLSPEIHSIPTSLSSHILNDDHKGAREANNDGSTKSVEQVHSKPSTPPVELELRRSTQERRTSTRYSLYEYVMLTDGGELKYFEEVMSHQLKVSGLKLCKKR